MISKYLAIFCMSTERGKLPLEINLKFPLTTLGSSLSNLRLKVKKNLILKEALNLFVNLSEICISYTKTFFPYFEFVFVIE